MRWPARRRLAREEGGGATFLCFYKSPKDGAGLQLSLSVAMTDYQNTLRLAAEWRTRERGGINMTIRRIESDMSVLITFYISLYLAKGYYIRDGN